MNSPSNAVIWMDAPVRTDGNKKVSTDQNEPFPPLPGTPLLESHPQPRHVWTSCLLPDTEQAVVIALDSHIPHYNYIIYCCVPPTRLWVGIVPHKAKYSGLIKTKKLFGHCSSWNRIHLPVSDMSWLSKDRLKYFAIISSRMGRLVKGEAVKKSTCGDILLSRFNDYQKAGLQQLKYYTA